MFKLCSNGGIFETLLSLHLKRLVRYSTSSAIAKTPAFMVDFMVNSLGFSRNEAISATNKVSAIKKKFSGKPDLVVEFLKQRGLNIAQIKKIVFSMPDLLLFKVDKTLEPKFNALQEMGVTSSDLVRIVSSNPSILRRGLSTRISPAMIFLKSIVGNHQNFLTVLRRSYWLMSCNIDTILQPNLDLLRRYGLSNERFRNFVVYNPCTLGHDPEKLANVLHRVEEEFGIPRDTRAFVDGIVLLTSLSDKTLESKFKIFKSYGWTELDIMTALRKQPRCFMLSETVICGRLEFFLNELGCEPAYIVSRPYLLTYSMEDRVVPRTAILRVLQEKKLVNKLGVLAAVCLSEQRFLKLYVLPFKDKLPELCEAYIRRKRGCSSAKDVC